MRHVCGLPAARVGPRRTRQSGQGRGMPRPPAGNVMPCHACRDGQVRCALDCTRRVVGREEGVAHGKPQAMTRRKAQPKKQAARGRKRAVGGKRRFEAIVQGAGMAPAVAFGRSTKLRLPRCLNAFLPDHLPLPRAVGPYTVIRTTERFTISDYCAVFGTFMPTRAAADIQRWSNTVCVSTAAGASATALNGAGAAHFRQIMSMRPNTWDRAVITPSAFSVQLMNANPLQTTTGVLYAGRLRTVPRWANVSPTWEDVAGWFLSYNTPRLLTAGKLALRGVQVDAVPMNMASLANFNELSIDAASTKLTPGTWDAASSSRSVEPRGFGPIMVLNEDLLEYQALVCVEWRVRFDPSNPAQAAHRQHPLATDALWATVLQAAEVAGNGVRDIAEVVAAAGQIAGAAGTLAAALL